MNDRSSERAPEDNYDLAIQHFRHARVHLDMAFQEIASGGSNNVIDHVRNARTDLYYFIKHYAKVI